MHLIAKNKRAYFDYEIIKKYEAGMVLLGTEIKSIRAHKVSLKGSFISVRNAQANWKGGQIARWEQAGRGSHEENRERKLLLNKKELVSIQKQIDEKGYTVVPLSLGLVGGKAKLEIGLARGKKQYDKRNTMKERDIAMKEVRKVVR